MTTEGSVSIPETDDRIFREPFIGTATESLNAPKGYSRGLEDGFAAAKRVVADLQLLGLIEKPPPRLTDEEVWLRAYIATIPEIGDISRKDGGPVSSVEFADEALAEFRKRWPK